MDNFKILLDIPAENPGLNFGGYASALAGLIQTSDARFAVGIFGGWGSGKTTLMNAIEREMDKTRVIPVRFSAWRYEKEKHLIVPLLDCLRDSLMTWQAEHREASEHVKEVAGTIGKVIYSLLAGFSMKIGVPNALELSLDANKALSQARELGTQKQNEKEGKSFYHSCFRALNDAFDAFVANDPQRRIVVFVDDLDRCLPEGALEVLESMKLFFDLRGFVFVVGLDRDVVEAVIEAKYAREDQTPKDSERPRYRVSGSEYIKKLFQVPFSLFPVAVSEIGSFLDSTYKEADLPQAQVDDLQDIVRPHLDYLVTESGINPREIKRYINAYTIVRKVKPDLRPSVVLALQTMEFRRDWMLARESLYAYRGAFLDALKRQIDGQADQLEALDPRLKGISRDFLRYVGVGNPGGELPSVVSIDEYLYAGEVTKSSSGFGFIADLVRDVTQLRWPIRRLRQQTGQTEDDNDINQLHSTIQEMIHKASSKDRLPNPYHQAAFDSLRELAESLRELGLPSTNRDEWGTRADALITQAVSDLVQGAR